MHPSSTRIAVVTGANKGIGLETVRQLAIQGVTVILTARDPKLGNDAVSSLHLSNVLFHQLDVRDDHSVAALADFIRAKFGKLDILVNNAGVSGLVVDVEGLRALNIDPETWLSGKATNMVMNKVIEQNFENAVICLDTNYYGCKRATEALLPLLKFSSSAAIVNVSSLRSELKRLPNEKIRGQVADIENLSEELIENVLEKFLEDLKKGNLESEGWPLMLPSYSMSKVALNAYTRVLAKRNPGMRINCVHPGYVKSDINWNTGVMTTEDGAKGPVMLTMLPPDGPSGCYFDQTTLAEF